MSEFKMLDIPPGVADELKRLHEFLWVAQSSDEDRHWVKARVEQIHNTFFCGALYIQDNGGIKIG